jgi:AcrR family transcriptional regulator
VSSRNDDRAHQPPRLPAERPGPVGGKRDANRRRRIAQLCDAALRLFLERGVGAVTIDQIVDGAGVAKGSFYRYFKDQAELVETLLGPLALAIRAAMDEAEAQLAGARSPDELPAIYGAMATALAASMGRHPDLLRFYLQECRSPAAGARRPVRVLADEIAGRAIRLSTVARDFGLLRDSDPRVGALTVIGAVERLAFAVLSGEDVGRVRALPATLVSIVLDGVRRTPTRR